jgi:hypothetical protein|tara:strand:- start:2349 stop:2546 length:198 start_codon:yes stop_codon:yes gene_type:complete
MKATKKHKHNYTEEQWLALSTIFEAFNENRRLKKMFTCNKGDRLHINDIEKGEIRTWELTKIENM